jgi:ribosomal protein S27AE
MALFAKRPHPGMLRRERRALLGAREERLRDLGGLTVEMYRRGTWREDLLQERCAEVIGIDARLAEIDELLHGSDGTERCPSCGAGVLRGSHFCPNCGRLLRDEEPGIDDTMIAPPEHGD